MKKYFAIAALSVLTIFTATAQDDAKLRRDVTYSTNNYKHPNKAAVARKWESAKGVDVNAPSLTKGAVASYKHQSPTAKPVGGVVTAHTPETDVAVRNYKIQRVNEPRSNNQPDAEVAAKLQ